MGACVFLGGMDVEQYTYTGNNQKVIERFLIVIYSLYIITMVYIAEMQKWSEWVANVLVICLAATWIVIIGKYKTYQFRAVFAAVMMQISVILYAIHLEDFSRALPVFIVFTVFLGLYGFEKIIYITVFSSILIFAYDGLIKNDFLFRSAPETMSALSQLANILLVEYVVYIWTKRNSEGSRQLLEVIEELKVVESSKDDFVANVSHEIRTPINTISGMSELILREELPYKIKENVLNIQTAGRNLKSVVSDILDYSELQSGTMELEEEVYNITSTINDVINMTMARKNEKKIELIVDCDANIPSALYGDEKKLRRIIMNLVDNAIKFTEEGCVTIRIGFRKEGYGINLAVTVKDTGIGMDEESLEKLFTSFSQVDTSRKRQEGGLGLGLAISRALVQKMGGAITVKSKLGKGSIIKFVVPQKVYDETPIAALNNRENIRVATYIDMEQFAMEAIRDEYSNCIVHMAEQLKGKCHNCRNLAELQRRERKEGFSHIFISSVEYRQASKYFDELALKTKVIVVLDIVDEKYVTNPGLLKIYKPFYILPIVSVLNARDDVTEAVNRSAIEKFVVKDAHVLVVDDNRMNIRVVEGLLANYKIKVTTANSGKAALEKIVSADYDFVFMDHMMPEMDGVETMQRIRHKVGTYYQKVPIIALTANAVAGTREMLLAEGFSDFLEKPIERSVLERVLKRNIAPEKIVSLDEYNDYVERKKEVTEAQQEAEMLSGFDKLAAEGLDVEKGILYCNGQEQYIQVLQGYCEECEDSGLLAEQLFEKKDWKNYTIAVHGMKSAMHSIGAMELSELAKQLEYAGKEGRIDYITEHHFELMDKYRKLFNNIKKNELIISSGNAVNPAEDEEQDLPVLEDAVFERMAEEMEEAMYDLDSAKLLEIMSDLQKYQYRGKALKTILTQAKRKVEMSDYVSAVEMVVRLKNGLANKEN